MANLENPAPPDPSANQDFLPLITYVIPSAEINRIRAEPGDIIRISSSFGVLNIDQKTFITADVSGAQEVSMYARLSESAPTMLEIMVVLQSTTSAKDVMGAFSQVLLFTTPITLILAGLLGFMLIRRMLKPMDVITQTIRGMGGNDLKRRIPQRGNDELSKLASVLNLTLGKLQSSFDRERGFSAEASHELKTPLALIRGEASMSLHKERSNEEYEKSLETISSEIVHMSSVIDRLLSLSRIANGSDMVLEDIDLAPFVADVAEDIEVLCEEKSIQFGYESSLEVLTVKGDRVRLRQVLLNLSDNAIKYTPSGGSVTLFMGIRNGYACIALSDSGIGIAPKHIKHIFEQFYRVDRSESGAGLGLALCQKIIEFHGGTIEVESKVGEGSTFSVLLPLST
jgi:signal transduction histidine kinase